MTLDVRTAASVIEACAAGIVFAGVWMAVTRSLGRLVWLVAAEAVLVGLVALTVGLATGAGHLVVGGLLAVAVRAGAVPGILFGVIRQSPVRRERSPYLGRRASLAAAIAIVFVAFVTARDVGRVAALGGAQTLPAALAAILTGLFLVTTRRKSLSIVVGLLSLENGLALAALSLTYGMPLVVELGISFDLLMLLVVVRVQSRRMLTTFGSLSTDELRSLRG